jgi:predicted RNA methylase
MFFKPEPRSAVLDDLGALYHSYALFGVANKQIPGIYELNQKAKEPIIRGYIQYAIAKSRARTADPVTFAELFCADGYYAMAARLLGASKSLGIDSGRDGHFELAPVIAARLGLGQIEFLRMDVNDIDGLPPVDIVANLGGLYHVSNPKEVLEKSFRMAERYLIIQSVVSMANDDENYFETPAPGWSWGCRFSRSSFLKMVRDLGYSVVDTHFNELEGNDRAEDRGSLYLLIQKPGRQ